MYTPMYICMYMYIYIQIYVYICMCIFICICIYVYMCMYICIYICMCIYIYWTNLDQELSFLLNTHLKGPIDHQLSSFCRVIYDVCLEWFGAVTNKKDITEGKGLSRRDHSEGVSRNKIRYEVVGR